MVNKVGSVGVECSSRDVKKKKKKKEKRNQRVAKSGGVGNWIVKE